MMRSKMRLSASAVNGPGLLLVDVFKDLIFAFGLVDGQCELPLDAADFMHDLGALR